MKLVFLIIDYVPHQELTIRKLIEKTGAEVLAFHVARFEQKIPEINNLNTIQYNSISKERILEQIKSFNPDGVVVAGWMIPEYIWIAKKLKKSLDVPIITYSDTQWYGTVRQRINALISKFHVRKAFTHIWVSGVYQFEYARRLGFEKNHIIFNSLSANTDLFQKIPILSSNNKHSKTFIYIGRFIEGKGVKDLAQAWSKIPKNSNWSLTFIGNGECKNYLLNRSNVIVKDYMSQEDLFKEIQNASCLILPSLKESWALILHEAAVSGKPIICTDICGAAPHFVIDGFNGFKVAPGNIISLVTAINKIIQMDELQLHEFSKRSRELGIQITPEISIASLLQVISK